MQTIHQKGSELKHKLDSPERQTNSTKQEYKVIYVIAGEFTSGCPSNNTRKRHAREVLIVAHNRRNHKSTKRRPPPLISNDKDVDMSIVLDHDNPLLVKTLINNKEVHQLLVNISSSTDIMFYDFFKNPIVKFPSLQRGPHRFL